MWVKLGDAQLTATTSRHQRSSTPWARVSTRVAATSLLHRSCASAGPTSCRCRRPRSRAATDARCAEGGASLLTSARKTLSVSMRLRRLSIPPVLTRHELRPESTASPGLVGDGAGSRFGWMGIERGRWGRGRDRGGRSSVVARSMPAPSVDGCTDQSPGVAAAGRGRPGRSVPPGRAGGRRGSGAGDLPSPGQSRQEARGGITTPPRRRRHVAPALPARVEHAARGRQRRRAGAARYSSRTFGAGKPSAPWPTCSRSPRGGSLARWAVIPPRAAR